MARQDRQYERPGWCVERVYQVVDPTPEIRRNGTKRVGVRSTSRLQLRRFTTGGAGPSGGQHVDPAHGSHARDAGQRVREGFGRGNGELGVSGRGWEFE